MKETENKQNGNQVSSNPISVLLPSKPSFIDEDLSGIEKVVGKEAIEKLNTQEIDVVNTILKNIKKNVMALEAILENHMIENIFDNLVVAEPVEKQPEMVYSIASPDDIKNLKIGQVIKFGYNYAKESLRGLVGRVSAQNSIGHHTNSVITSCYYGGAIEEIYEKTDYGDTILIGQEINKESSPNQTAKEENQMYDYTNDPKTDEKDGYSEQEKENQEKDQENVKD